MAISFAHPGKRSLLHREGKAVRWPGQGPGEWSPPFFSVHGTADPVLPIAAMREAIAAIEGRGYNVKHWEYEGMEHGLSAAAHGQAMGVMSQQLAVQSAL